MCTSTPPCSRQRAFNWFVNAINPPSGLPRWVLAAGNAPPADLQLARRPALAPGLGHVFQLQVPDESERRAILQTEAAARGVILSADVLGLHAQALLARSGQPDAAAGYAG